MVRSLSTSSLPGGSAPWAARLSRFTGTQRFASQPCDWFAFRDVDCSLRFANSLWQTTYVFHPAFRSRGVKWFADFEQEFPIWLLLARYLGPNLRSYWERLSKLTLFTSDTQLFWLFAAFTSGMIEQ